MGVPLSDIEPLRLLLARWPLGIVSDIDGTLAPIVPRPEDARVSVRCREALAQLIDRGVKVALATGRDLEIARMMVGLEGVAYAANHGLTMWIDGREETPEAVREYEGRARQVVAEIGRIDVPGVLVEEKGPVLAFHYRRAADQGEARGAVLAAIEGSASARSFRVHEGRKVIELRPPLAVDKGTAVAGLIERLGMRAVICMGDDTTDMDMFREVARLRQGGLPGANIAVGSDEATLEVMAAADYLVEGVEGVESLLADIVTALRATPP